jgi:hypothetical protein
MIYNLTDKINYGVHKGYSILKIYQYDPSYIEWLIK